MPVIKLTTLINSDRQTCFGISRTIDAHAESMSGSKESAIAGRTSGLIQLHETVTWRARHFGIVWTLTSRITQMDAPNSFTDEIIQGPFRRMRHKHSFTIEGDKTLMTDEFDYSAPWGPLGKLADALFLKKYLPLLHRHQSI